MKELLTSMMRNPAQGVRGHRPRSTCPAWGVSSLATDRTAEDFLRRSLANPTTANSSTMKGPRGLAGEFCGRRCRAANGFGWWVRGCFYVRPPEMMAELQVAIRHRNYAGSGELDIRPNPLPVTRDSDVIRKIKEVANAGSSMAAGVVTGAWLGQSSASNAVEWECGLIRSRVCRKRELAGELERWLCKAVQSRWRCRVVPTTGHDERADGQFFC